MELVTLSWGDWWSWPGRCLAPGKVLTEWEFLPNHDVCELSEIGQISNQ